MTPAKVVKRALYGSAAIAEIVGTRIWPVIAPEKCIQPYITYTMIGCAPEPTQDGPMNMQNPAVQIDCYVPIYQYDILEALHQAVIDCLNTSESPGWRYFFITNNGTDMVEPEARLSRKMIQADVWHNVDVSA